MASASAVYKVSDRGLIYIASPYTARTGDSVAYNSGKVTDIQDAMRVIRRRASAVTKFAAELTSRGMLVYSPIAHGHSLHGHHRGLPIPYQLWIQSGLDMLARCNALYVYCYPGWQTSNGVRIEINFALSMDLPVTYYHHTTYKRVDL